ncbi:MAG: thioredoxin family protein [Planctomycetes bacterium]|nr:thioredoxin family protein [Planctomycetota bacterium]
MDRSSTLLLIAVALAILMMSTAGCTQRKPGINAVKVEEALAWHESLNSAITEAKQRHTLIAVDVYTNRCSWCKRMEKSTLSDSDVKNRLRKFSLLKLDARVSAIRRLPSSLDSRPVPCGLRYARPT